MKTLGKQTAAGEITLKKGGRALGKREGIATFVSTGTEKMFS